MKVKYNQSPARYERKYLVCTPYPQDIENLIALHPACFQEIYYPRTINNIYFDSFNLQNYYDNINGSPNRIKVRVRWYGNSNKVENPNLEIKKKQGEIIIKDSVPFPNFSFPLFSTHKTFLTFPLNTLQPVLFNSYRRRYFLSHNKKIRLTIDSHLNFQAIKNKKVDTQQHHSLPTTIMEMKYHPSDDKDASHIARLFPFRLTKSSKYVFGMNFVLGEKHDY